MLVADEGKFCDSTSPLIPEILALKDEAFGFMSAAGHLVPAEMRTRFWSYCLYHDGCGCEFDLERATREAFEYFGPEGIQELVDQGVASFYPWPEPGPSTQTIYK